VDRIYLRIIFPFSDKEPLLVGQWDIDAMYFKTKRAITLYFSNIELPSSSSLCEEIELRKKRKVIYRIAILVNIRKMLTEKYYFCIYFF